MLEMKKLDDELYRAMYGKPRVGDVAAIWGKIRNNPEVLKEAIKITRNKWNNGDTVEGMTICDAMLIDYPHVNKEVYEELIKTIYTNTDIARTVVDGASNGGYSYLLMSLWNKNMKLTEEQKAFAVREAMNKIGTTTYRNKMNAYIEELKEKSITDEKVVFLDIDGSYNPMGARTANMYITEILNSISPTQAHGSGCYDIRYWILRNPNWSIEEKQQLIMDFWEDNEDYDDALEEWEWGIVNDEANFKKDLFPPFNKYELLNEYTYDMLLKFYGNKEITDRIWEEIEFCKQMHKLRPQQWEIGADTPKVLTKNKN